jgi:hypothetical protein
MHCWERHEARIAVRVVGSDAALAPFERLPIARSALEGGQARRPTLPPTATAARDRDRGGCADDPADEK